jgi:hypothetical protein
MVGEPDFSQAEIDGPRGQDDRVTGGVAAQGRVHVVISGKTHGERIGGESLTWQGDGGLREWEGCLT